MGGGGGSKARRDIVRFPLERPLCWDEQVVVSKLRTSQGAVSDHFHLRAAKGGTHTLINIPHDSYDIRIVQFIKVQSPRKCLKLPN